MCFSVFLAMVIGFFCTITGLAFLIQRERYKKTCVEFASNYPLLAISGQISLLLGLLIVISHNIWSGHWRILITLTGWFLVVQGVWRLFFPEKVSKFVKRVVDGPGYLICMAIVFLVGIYLLAVVFS